MTRNSTSSDDSFPSSGRIAAIDYGTVRIGVAVCDPDRILASPLKVIPAAGWRVNGAEFRALIQAESIDALVVGLPIHSDGGESAKSAETREFAKWLAQETELPVRLFDERFTTVDANRRLAASGFSRQKKKKRVDAIAALVLLESFLEACRYRGETVGEPVDAKPTGGESL